MEPIIVTGEEAILMWCNNKINPYNYKVTDFGPCWNNGKIVCMILYTLFPKEIDLNDLNFDDPMSAMKKCFDVMDKNRVVRYLEPQDFLMKKPDTKSITLFASELMQFDSGNYEFYDEEKFERVRKEREERERKEEEEIQRLKLEAIEALPKCVICNQPITQSVFEFCGKKYHEACVKCTSCKKPVKYKALEVDSDPFCELCARNSFKQKVAEGWVPPKGVTNPPSFRITRTAAQYTPPSPSTNELSDSAKKSEVEDSGKKKEIDENLKKKEEELRKAQKEIDEKRQAERLKREKEEQQRKEEAARIEKERQMAARKRQQEEDQRKKEERKQKEEEMKKSASLRAEQSVEMRKKKEEDIQKQRQEMEEAKGVPSCFACKKPIPSSAVEFCSQVFHDACMKCMTCKKPVKFKCLEVDLDPYCELCARNAFKRKLDEGWVPPSGVTKPVAARITSYVKK